MPVDFGRQELGPACEEVWFTFQKPAVFSWLGVTMYLTPEAIDQTLSTIALGAAGTRVVLTYNQPDRVLDDHAVRVTSALRSIAAGFGEPFVTLFTADEIDALLRQHGFDVLEHIGREGLERGTSALTRASRSPAPRRWSAPWFVRRPRSARHRCEAA